MHYLLTPPQQVINGTVTIAASKSFTNRALICASAATGISTIKSFSPSDDSAALLGALEQIGLQVTYQHGDVTIAGGPDTILVGDRTIDVGPAGTTMRFLVSLLAATNSGTTVLRGSERMHERPIKDLVSALRDLGATIEYVGKDGCPPLKITGKQLRGGSVTVSGSTSSQFLTSLLLAGPLCPEGLTVSVAGGLVSSSYVGSTLSVMRSFGVAVSAESGSVAFHVPTGSRYTPTTYLPEGDASGATYLWGIAALSGGYVRVSNIDRASEQGDIQFVSLLEQMGCTITSGTESGVPWIGVQGPRQLRSISTDMTLLPDAAQTLAVVAAAAEGTSTITGLSTLVVKETNRIAATVAELKRCGIEASGTQDSLTITGGKPLPTEGIKTYDDHRMAMAFAMLGARYPGVMIDNPKVTSKSYPSFWEDIASLGVSLTTTP